MIACRGYLPCSRAEFRFSRIAVKRLRQTPPQQPHIEFEDHHVRLQQGKADAYVQDYTYTVYHANRDPKTLAYLDKPLAYAPYSFAIRKYDQEWRDYLNFFIYRLHQTGKMKELYKKHFGEEPKITPTW